MGDEIIVEPDRCEYVSDVDGLQCELFVDHELPHVLIEGQCTERDE